MLLHTLVTHLHQVAQEDGSFPGKGMTAIQTALIFFAAPIGLFVAIGGIAYVLSGEKKKSTSAISHIE
ncbi:MAG: hypothetical protein WCO08_06580 [Actinomycetes bacterium]